jgi:NAD(P)-dependent dehydrogenase (short-subunit alcohol dehydrogenase family)
MIDLKERNVFITGSTQGVGAAIAVACTNAGANVVLHGLTEDQHALDACESCRAGGTDVKLVTGDLTGAAASGVEEVFQKAIAANPKIDILINNAGTYIDNDFLEMDFATFDKTMKLNVYAYFFMTQRFARRWVDRKQSASVLLIGSINGRLAEPMHAAYDTSKGAVEMMVKTLCVSLAPYQIRVNGLSPGLFYTPLTAAAIDHPATRNWMQLHTPNGEIPGPEVCGEAAVYLVSHAARHVTGQMLLVDGGMSAWQQPDAPLD